MFAWAWYNNSLLQLIPVQMILLLLVLCLFLSYAVGVVAAIGTPEAGPAIYFRFFHHWEQRDRPGSPQLGNFIQQTSSKSPAIETYPELNLLKCNQSQISMMKIKLTWNVIGFNLSDHQQTLNWKDHCEMITCFENIFATTDSDWSSTPE